MWKEIVWKMKVVWVCSSESENRFVWAGLQWCARVQPDKIRACLSSVQAKYVLKKVACRTDSFFCILQESAKASAKRESRATGRDGIRTRDLRSVLASCFVLNFALACKTQNITPVLQAT